MPRRFSSRYLCGHPAMANPADLKGTATWQIAQWHQRVARDRCPDCRRAWVAERHAAAVEAADRLGLPPLTGTPDEVAWADVVRIETLDRVRRALQGRPANADSLLLAWAAARTRADWWLECPHRKESKLVAQVRETAAPAS